MISRKCGALRSHHILHSCCVTSNQIELPFAKNCFFFFKDGAFRLVEAEEDFALGEDGRLRRVDILRRLLIAGQDTPAEADDAALFVADRKHEPATEAVVIAIALFLQFPELLPDYEPHKGEFPGKHGRYRLETPVTVVEGGAS